LANTRSAKKKNRSDEAKQSRNKTIRSRTRTLVSQARKSIDRNTDNPSVAVASATQALDKAAGKKIIHPNNAARRKSRLVKQLNKNQAK